MPQELGLGVGAGQEGHAEELDHTHYGAVDVWLQVEHAHRRDCHKLVEILFLCVCVCVCEREIKNESNVCVL